MTGDQVSMEPPHIYVERTLAIIKPDALHKAEEIEDIIVRSGFAVLQVKLIFDVRFGIVTFLRRFKYTAYMTFVGQNNLVEP